MSEVAIRDAAAVVVVRDGAGGASVLMGQRGAGAVFMPSKFVFPGGAVDPGDGDVAPSRPLPDREARRLGEHADGALAGALPMTAIRELWEEAGLRLSARGDWPDAPRGWRGFAEGGHRPDASGLRFVFRAITPPGRPRRFDARFFLADAAAIAGDPDDFSAAEDELSDVGWVPMAEARSLDLPFITELVLAEVGAILGGRPQDGVPFLRGGDEETLFARLHGRPQDR